MDWFHLRDLLSFKEWLEELVSGHKEPKMLLTKEIGEEKFQ